MALFGSAKPDHPMADIKLARKLISELPAGDSLKALDEVTFWLDSISRTEGFRVDYCYELYGLLDYAAKTHQRKLSQEYLTTDRQEKFRENKLWTTTFEFWKRLGNAYAQCLEKFQANESGAGTVKKDVPAIVARILRALTLQLKWILLRYGPIDNRVWGDLGKVYFFAETKGIVTTPVEIYPGAHGRGTIQQEFLKAMMVGISSTDGLTPIKQEIAERIVAHFGSLFSVSRQPAAGCNYYFDLSLPKPAARVQKHTQASTTIRYFGAATALPALQKAIKDTKSSGAVPSDINLGGTYSAELVLSVMQHLAMYWSGDPPARNSERRMIASRMTVVHGYQNMLVKLAPAHDAASLDFNVQDDGAESWIVENVSEGGFGAIIPQVKGDWIKVGDLLCVQTETAKFWGAGIVRRITRDEYQQRRVGIQLLSKAVNLVVVAPAGEESSPDANRDGEPAVLLSTSPDKRGEIALLLRAGSFLPNQSLEMNVHGKPYFLTPSKMAEGGEDFDWAKFRIMHRM